MPGKLTIVVEWEWVRKGGVILARLIRPNNGGQWFYMRRIHL